MSGAGIRRQAAPAAGTEQPLARRLADLWANRSPKEIASRLAAPLYGTAGEWDLPSDVTPKRDLLYLAVGIPDAESLPKKALLAAAEKVLARPGDLALRYGFGQGPSGIREWLAARRSADGFEVGADWFQMTNGSSGAIDLVVRSLIDPGDVIVAETPTYMGTLHNFRGVGAEVHQIAVDEQGLDVEALDGTLAALAAAGKRVKLIYTISAFQNPTGVTLSLPRRQALLAVAARHQVLILDDEAYRELWFDEPPPPALSALAEGWGVITVGTLSKTLATGLRVGWIHARPELLALFARMRFAMGQNQLGLRMVQALLEAGEYEPHLERVRELYRHKRDVLDAALRREVGEYMDWRRPEGGFYLWARLRAPLTMQSLWRTAVAEGIAVNPGSGFIAGGEGEEAIRIAYPWTPVEQFDEAARRLRLACERIVRGDPA